MLKYLLSEWIAIAVFTVLVSIVLLAMRAWLLRQPTPAGGWPMQSRILVENSWLAIVADSFCFALLYQVLTFLIQGTNISGWFALLAILVTPLQIKGVAEWFTSRSASQKPPKA